LKILGFLALLLGFVGCSAGACVVGNQILEDVNARLPAAERFGWLGWHTGKEFRFWDAYFRLALPRRRLVWQVGLSLGASICFGLLVWIASTVAGP